jgi:hypothetical protein
MTLIEAAKLALEALERYAPQHGHPDDMSEAITALRTAIEQANDLERLRDENERLHVENRRLIDRIEVMGVPVGVGGYLTTTTTPPAAQREPAPGYCKHCKQYTIEEPLPAQPAPVQVSPTDFVDMVMDKEDAIGKPIFWAEWPNREKNT